MDTGIFEPTPKFNSGAAMVLHGLSLDTSWPDEQTGDVEWDCYISFFKGLTKESAYLAVKDYIETNYGEPNTNVVEANRILAQSISWFDCVDMIEALAEGRNWIVTENDQGFVGCWFVKDDDAAQAEFDELAIEYSKWLDQDDVQCHCGGMHSPPVCSEK